MGKFDRDRSASSLRYYMFSCASLDIGPLFKGIVQPLPRQRLPEALLDFRWVAKPFVEKFLVRFLAADIDIIAMPKLVFEETIDEIVSA